ncbi:regulatory protein, luxR family [Actinopolyspora mzabensis]|uniref:Regulatory protein, luxR family n=1 Tax=Actinopolyspora mzabensis TaxID=995066 RepID=A0A1G9AV64_ACTMZ|nr:helix-turn-helix transcriptional regulator [Actinopolyspora mzabensis]SDK30784.1 regulatory protein, luxR family [Actinopolyspora mzabensis]
MNHPSATRPAPDTGSAARLREVAPHREATRLRQEIAANPNKPLTAVVRAPGGYGKTSLLNLLAHTYREAGTAVRESAEFDPAEIRSGAAALLLDDAHLLSAATLREVEALAAAGPVRVILACRPWPFPEELARLCARFATGRPLVELSELGVPEISEALRGVSTAPGDTETAQRLRMFTGGVPALVGRAMETLEPRELAAGGTERLPRTALDRFDHELSALDRTARGCLTALAIGAEPHPALLATVLDAESPEITTALAALRSAGLLDDTDTPPPMVARAVLALTDWQQRLAVLRVLLRVRLDRGGPVLPLLRPLLGTESVLPCDDTLAAAFDAAGGQALSRSSEVGESPEVAVRMFDAAVSTGLPASSVTARKAWAVALAGRFDEALRLADRVIADETASDRATAIQVAAAVLTHRGLPERAAELCRWSARHVRWPGDSSCAVLGLLCTGRLDEAVELLRTGVEEPPTSVAGASTQLASGLHESVDGAASEALNTLVRAASLAEPVGASLLTPDTPAAVAATVALHGGEPDLADSVLRRAVTADSGGPLFRTRHRLLAIWLPLLRGDTTVAKRELAALLSEVEELSPRDRLHAVAIEAGIASRDNDMAALGEARTRARRATAEHPVDLFALLPLGELAVATARLRDGDWLLPQLRQAHELLAALGEPPLWAAPLRWREMQAAIVVEEYDRAAEHAAVLDRMARHNQLAAALAAAGGVWLRVLENEVDPTEVEGAARTLHAVGLAWDGAGLAGQAAIRTTDRNAMPALLECARGLSGKGNRSQRQSSGTGGDLGAAADETQLLSDREREVAELVLGGMTYKQVGQRLFISAKTVEHHIGRIKQRLDCADRQQLLEKLRSLLR